MQRLPPQAVLSLCYNLWDIRYEQPLIKGLIVGVMWPRHPKGLLIRPCENSDVVYRIYFFYQVILYMISIGKKITNYKNNVH